MNHQEKRQHQLRPSFPTYNRPSLDNDFDLSGDSDFIEEEFERIRMRSGSRNTNGQGACNENDHVQNPPDDTVHADELDSSRPVPNTSSPTDHQHYGITNQSKRKNTSTTSPAVFTDAGPSRAANVGGHGPYANSVINNQPHQRFEKQRPGNSNVTPHNNERTSMTATANDVRGSVIPNVEYVGQRSNVHTSERNSMTAAADHMRECANSNKAYAGQRNPQASSLNNEKQHRVSRSASIAAKEATPAPPNSSYDARSFKRSVSKYLRELQSSVDLIQFDINDIKLSLRQMAGDRQNEAVSRAESGLEPFNIAGVSLPCQNWGHLLELESTLGDSSPVYSGFVKHLALLGGCDAPKTTYRILERVICPVLSQEITWTGKSSNRQLSKKKFQDLPGFFNVICDVVWKNHGSDSKLHSKDRIKKAVQDWLRHCHDRMNAAQSSMN